MLLEDTQYDQDDRLRHRPRPRPHARKRWPPRRRSIPKVTRRRSRSSASRSRAAIYSRSPGRCIIWPPARRRRASTPPREIETQLSEPNGSVPADQRWFFDLIKTNLAEDVNDRYFSAREIKADLDKRQVTREDRLPEVPARQQGARAVLRQVRRAANRSDAAVPPLRQDQPHGQSLLHPLWQSSPLLYRCESASARSASKGDDP